MQQKESREVMNPALLAVGCDPDVLAMRLQVGKFRALHSDAVISIGVPGWPDTLCIVAVTITPEMVGQRVGVAVAAEMKTATGRQRDAQQNFETAIVKRGGIYRLIRSAEQLTELICKVKKWQHKN